MGCYMLLKDDLYISYYDGLEEDILSVENAIVEIKDCYIKLSPLKSGFSFAPTQHYLIYKSEKMKSYCELCHERTRAITGFCKPCVFNPLIEEMYTMDKKIMLGKLKHMQFYEADRLNFHLYVEKTRREKTKH